MLYNCGLLTTLAPKLKKKVNQLYQTSVLENISPFYEVARLMKNPHYSTAVNALM